VTEYIVTIKLLVAAWPESANIRAHHPIQMIQTIQTIQNERNTVYNPSGQGLVELQRFILRLCPACEPSGDTLCELNYRTERHACAAVF
jgi:hypothetical protein